MKASSDFRLPPETAPRGNGEGRPREAQVVVERRA
jgi:hypothetical protein